MAAPAYTHAKRWFPMSMSPRTQSQPSWSKLDPPRRPNHQPTRNGENMPIVCVVPVLLFEPARSVPRPDMSLARLNRATKSPHVARSGPLDASIRVTGTLDPILSSTPRFPEKGVYVLEKLEKVIAQNPMEWPKSDLFHLSSFSRYTSTINATTAATSRYRHAERSEESMCEAPSNRAEHSYRRSRCNPNAPR